MRKLDLGTAMMMKKIGQGKTNASNFLRENKKIRNALVKQIKAAHIKSKAKKK